MPIKVSSHTYIGNGKIGVEDRLEKDGFRYVGGSLELSLTIESEETSTWVILGKDSEYIGEYDDRIELSDIAKIPVEDVPTPINGAKILVRGVLYSVGKIIKASKYFTKFYIKKI